MAGKKILAIGMHLASKEMAEEDFDSRVSLLDWDIILFRPEIRQYLDYAGTYQGKLSLTDTNSFRLKEESEHWRREIKQAFDHGKTVLIFLPEFLEFYVDSGRRSYSGTGRNQQVTRHVSSYNNYECLPFSLAPIAAKGSSMKLVSKGAEILAPYWKEFEKYSTYEAILTNERIPAVLITKNGDKPVGLMARSKSSAGTILVLPNLDIYREEFFEDEDGEQVWSEAGEQFSMRLVSTVVALDKALRSEGELTPEPEWVQSPVYELDAEKSIRSKLLLLEGEIEKLEQEKEDLRDQLHQSGRLRNLLFEKGKPLEYAIIDALTILGFTAAPYKDTESEFDVVFESEEGRLIGEAEGKDNKAINVDKLRQLSMNIHEDLQRECVDKAAKGVLFGNAYRLMPLQERPDPFTEKCVNAALSQSIALLTTSDFFQVVHYLANIQDHEFAAQCRRAIVEAVGRVIFPEPPKNASNTMETINPPVSEKSE